MNPLAVLMPGFAGTTLPGWVDRRLREGLAGVCLFADNVESPAQLRALAAAIYDANPHAVISMDEEGGDVTRLYQRVGSPFPGNAVLGRLADSSLTAAVAHQVGWELRDVGVGLALAPDADVNSNPANPVIGVRSFGADAYSVAAQTAAWTRGLQSTGVAACAKHFPGHGDTDADSHVDLPVVSATAKQLRERELVPFSSAIAAGTQTIMTSHILVPSVDDRMPATLSPLILQGLLRGEMHFEGVIVSDALDMAGVSAHRGIPQAAALALAAGCDLLCLGTDNSDDEVDQIAAAITYAAGGPTLAEHRLSDAIARVAGLGQQLARARTERPVPRGLIPGVVPGIDRALLRSAFTVSGRARALLDGVGTRPVVWLALETDANVAVGTGPWGPFSDGGLAPAASVRPGDDPSVLREAVSSGALAIVVGKDNHRHPWVRDVIDALRQEVETIVVDMGWPEPTYAYADIATYGASRVVGDALREMVEA